MDVDIANKLVELRKKHGYSQESLAEKLGISRQAVSKWERAEASPDTDNLILLARIYGISLDELFGITASEKREDDRSKDAEEKKKAGINITRSNGESVHIGWDGVHVKEGDNKNVQVGWNGVHVDGDDVVVNVDGEGVAVLDKDGKYIAKYGGEPVPEEQKAKNYKEVEDYYLFRNNKRNAFLRIPLSIICIIAYILIGTFFGLWHPTWIIFLLIPIIDTFVTAISLRDFHRFAYPIVALVTFLSLGFFLNLWHPGWVVFLTIPIYGAIFPRKYKKSKSSDNPSSDTPEMI